MHNFRMPAEPQLRFAPTVRSARVRDRLRGGLVTMSLPREEGMALLDSLGFGRSEFGAVAARELAPRCRRLLWEVYSNDPAGPRPTSTPSPSIERRRARVRELLTLAEAAGEDLVMFG